MLGTYPLFYSVHVFFIKCPPFPLVGRGSVRLQFSLLLLLKTFPFPSFIQNVNIINYFVITGRTRKCSDLLHGANGCCQPIHQFIKVIHIWNRWICPLKCQAQSALHFGFILPFWFSAKWIAYCLVIALSSDIYFPVAMPACIKIPNWMPRPTTFPAASEWGTMLKSPWLLGAE